MKVVDMDIDVLKPYDKNPRVNKNAVDAVKRSIKKLGFNQPIVCNQKDIICVGHTRWEAAKELGLKKVPVYKKRMSNKEFIAYNLADNRTADNSKWDTDKVGELLKELDEDDSLMLELTGFTDSEIEAFLAEPEPDEEIEVAGYTRANPGEKSSTRVVTICLDDITFPKFIEMVDEIQPMIGTSNMTDTVYGAVEKLYDEL